MWIEKLTVMAIDECNCNGKPKEETFKVHLNITDITKPMLYVEFAQLQYVAQ